MPHKSLRRKIAATVGVVVLLAGVSACADDDTADSPNTGNGDGSSVTVSDVWARPSIAGGNTAIYLLIDGGDIDDALVAVTTDGDLADSTEIHETVLVDPDSDSQDPDSVDESNDTGQDDADDGHDMPAAPGGQTRMMRAVESIDVPAGGSVALEPGGYHVMVMNLGSELSVGDSFSATFQFEHAGAKQAAVEVREF